ncbi:DUF1292 domain-containing protein [Paenibacillus sp. IB182496]|uniref:DUF1292 domain-containing protein n=1 Tax=Paenibacillus sabuli TaxID=2772509 RepID=A0A927BPW4_9BACL|nr:DUF1292 domain-containing protein [Paenibacillus sabuli]MBD2844543.1 DUF1292 domain-containing protein [Paenibacillus sabuli]
MHQAVKRIRVLAEQYGKEVLLVDEQGAEEAYRIAAEFEYEGTAYAGLQTKAMRKADEIAFFRIGRSPEGQPELLPLASDDEWENVSEAYDDLVFGGEDTP